MKKTAKRIFSVLLAAAMVLTATVLVMAVGAGEAKAATSGDWEYMLRQTGSDQYISISRYLGNDENVVIPAAIEGCPVKELYDDTPTFVFGKKNIRTITFPASLTVIHGIRYENMDLIFHGPFEIPTLEAYIVDPANPAFSSVDGVLFDKAQATLFEYPDSKKGEAYTVPGTVKSIWSEAFEDAYGLNKIVLPDKLESIGASAFASMAISELNIPDSVTAFGSSPFKNCKNLKYIKWPKGCTTIGWWVLEYCTNFEQIYIPKSVKKIDKLLDPYGMTIVGEAGSYAEQFAKNYAKRFHLKDKRNIPFLSTSAPPKIKGVKIAQESAESLKISWEKQSGITGYKVYMKTSGGDYSCVATIADPKKASFTETGLSSGKSYSFRVRAYKDLKVLGKIKYGSYSEAIGCAIPSAPANVKAGAAGADSIKISWDKVKYANGYRVYRLGKSGKYEKIADLSGQAATSYTDGNRKANKLYAYKVKAYTASKGAKIYGGYSGEAKGAAVKTPASPSVKAQTATSVTVKWGKVSGVSGYEIRYRTGSENYKSVSAAGASTVEATVPDLAAGAAYTVAIRAYVEIEGVRYYSRSTSALTVTL
jgi:hypothetical protein